MAEESNALAMVLCILLCLFIAADGDAAANLKNGTASLDNSIRTPGLNCDKLPSSNIIATVSAPIYTVDMCGATYIIQCKSDKSTDTDPSYKNPCINVNNNEVTVTVTIVGQCDANAGKDCTSSFQISPDAYNAIVGDPSISTSTLVRINYGPTTNTASVSVSASASGTVV